MPVSLSHRLAAVIATVALLGPALAWAAAPTIVIPGPKRTIGIGAIDVIGTYANSSSTNAGGAIAGSLATRLQASRCCDVVERDALNQLITEMDMAKSGVTTGTAAPKPGNVLPAQYIIVGSVTAQSTNDRGGGLSIGTGATALNLGGSQGDVEIDLRLVDTRTSAVIAAFKVRHKITSRAIGLTTNISGVSVGPNAFFNTPQGKATDAALDDAVVQIEEALAAQPWRGQVVKYDAGVVWVNDGGDGGVHVGDTFAVERVGETLTDPATGKVLQQTMQQLGIVTVTDVQPAIAWGAYKASLPGDPARGDFLVMQPR